MAAAAKGYRVIGALAVIRKNGHERYVAKGGVFGADQLDADNAKHLLGVGLIEAANIAAPEKSESSPITQADVDAALKAASEAKDTELAKAQSDLAAAVAEADQAKAELAKVQPAPKA